jgi:16S rRNA G966 N2-methylase RsmD
VSQLAEQIISLAMEPAAGVLRVACVKNRHGMHDANAEDFETVYVDPPRMTLYSSMQEMQMAHTRRQWH